MRGIHATIVMLGVVSAPQAQEATRSMSQLIAEGYEVKAMSDNWVILQKGSSVYECEPNFTAREDAAAQAFRTAPCWSIAG
jgi:hypothetical protein